MDLKCGNGAFMQNFADAQALAKSIIEVANGAGTKTTALITDMNQILGKTAGNAVEIKEVLKYLKGEKIDLRLDKVTRSLCVELLQLCGRCPDEKTANALVEKALNSGQA
jgi:thymidine phosphorylase